MLRRLTQSKGWKFFGVLPKADRPLACAWNTKALTTLMLAKLVDEKKLTWETHATDLLPSFKLGDADTSSEVLVRHLICACTGLPRQDMEWLFEFKGATPQSALATLATMQPTSKFGELFQYSNPLASAAGFIGGHVAYPKLAARYAIPSLGGIMVTRSVGKTVFDFGEWRSEVASRKNPDGSISFITTRPGIGGIEFVVGAGEKRTLVIRDAQHEYAFEAN